MSLVMTYLVAIALGLLGAAAGWLAGGAAEPYAPLWLTIAGLRVAGVAIGAIGLREAGALFGFIMGAILAIRFYGGYRRKAALLVHGALVTLITGGLIYGASVGGNVLFEALGINPLAPVVEFEIRLPSGARLPTAQDDVQVELHTDRNEIIAIINGKIMVGDRPVLSGHAPLVFRTTQRSIVMSLAGQPLQVFRLRLPARPSSSADYGPWQQVDFLGEATKEVHRADVTADYAIRYRVR